MGKVLLENTEHFQIDSEYTNYSYDIKVSIPSVEPPKEGFPVYYVLDGNWYFQLARDVVKLQSKNSLKTLISPSIVIGIGHSERDEEARIYLSQKTTGEGFRRAWGIREVPSVYKG